MTPLTLHKFPVGGYLIPDGTVVWIIDDVRDGTPVGMVRASVFLPDGYIKANGATVLRADYPRLVYLADKHNLWTEDTANYPGLFGVGDGLTTFIVPNWIDRVAQFGIGIGNAISAGLPNITGARGWMCGYDTDNAWAGAGALYTGAANIQQILGSGTNCVCFTLSFDASRSNSLYGNSDTVQPPAIGVLPILKY